VSLLRSMAALRPLAVNEERGIFCVHSSLLAACLVRAPIETTQNRIT